MTNSNIPIIEEELIKIIKSDDYKLREYIFDNNQVFPYVPITRVLEFREEILRYINSEKFISTYKRLPTQYLIAFKKDDTFIRDSSELEIKEYILAVKLIDDDKIKLDLINDILEEIPHDIDLLKYYKISLQEEFPKLELKNITKNIKSNIDKIEKFNSFNIKEDPILKYSNGTEIYEKEDTSNILCFKNNENIEFYKYPFKKDDIKKLELFLDKDTKEITTLIELVLSMKNNNILQEENLIKYIKYENYFDWRYKLKNDLIINFAIKTLINTNNNSNIIKISNWLGNKHKYYFHNFNIDEELKLEKNIKKLMKLQIESHLKLFLLSLLTTKEKYTPWIEKTISLMNTSKDNHIINECKNILYIVLENNN